MIMAGMMNLVRKAIGPRERGERGPSEGVEGAVSPEGAGACQKGGMSGVADISGREEGTTSDVMQKGVTHT